MALKVLQRYFSRKWNIFNNFKSFNFFKNLKKFKKFLKRTLIIAAVLSVACIAIVSYGGGVFDGPVLRSALATPLFRFYLSIAAISLLVISVILGFAARKRRKPLPATAGTIIIEFTLVLPILLMLSLILLQSSLVLAGHLCVTYAGFCAARSAIVQIPQNYTDEKTNYLNTSGDSQKMSHILDAACWAVMPVCDGSYAGSTADDRLTQGFETLYSENGQTAPKWVSSYLAAKLAYAKSHTTVTVAVPEEDDYYSEHEDIKVDVTHDLYLSVPYADVLLATLDSDHAVELSDDKRAIRVTTTCTLTNQGTSMEIPVESFPKTDDD